MIWTFPLNFFVVTLTVPVPIVTASSSCANLLVSDTSNVSGIIQSSLVSTYPNNINCQWHLSSNTTLELVFSIFKTRASDYLSLYDGTSASSNLIGRFSGEILPGPYALSTTNNLYLTFSSSSAGSTDFGFRARYRGDLPLNYLLFNRTTMILITM